MYAEYLNKWLTVIKILTSFSRHDVNEFSYVSRTSTAQDRSVHILAAFRGCYQFVLFSAALSLTAIR